MYPGRGQEAPYIPASLQLLLPVPKLVLLVFCWIRVHIVSRSASHPGNRAAWKDDCPRIADGGLSQSANLRCEWGNGRVERPAGICASRSSGNLHGLTNSLQPQICSTSYWSQKFRQQGSKFFWGIKLLKNKMNWVMKMRERLRWFFYLQDFSHLRPSKW